MSFELAKGTAVEDVDGTTVLVSVTDDSVVLNGSANMILNFLLSCPDTESAFDCLMKIYNVDLATITEDAHTVIRELSRHGMLEIRDR